MNRTLLAKELRALRPYTVCILALSVLLTGLMFFDEMPDAQRFDPARWLDKSRFGSFLFLMLFSMLLGSGLLVQESEERTLQFLDGLPLSRTRVFVMKALAAFLVISLVPATDVGSDLIFSALSRTSIDPPFAWNFMATEFGLQLLAGAYLVGVALLISFTRAWFALITGLLLFAFIWFRQRGLHWLSHFDTYALLSPAYVDSKVHAPWPQVCAHLGGALGFYGLAWLAFLSIGDRAQFTIDRLGRLRWLGMLGTGARWIAPIVWIAGMILLLQNNDTSKPGADSPVGEGAFSQQESKHYLFLFRTSQAAQAKPLAAAGDIAYERVVRYLGAPPASTRVVVDLASPVVSHAVGQTNWTKIRMPLNGETALDELLLILGHETTHVFIEQLSDGRMSRHFNECRCFHEGLATYVELNAFGHESDRALNRRAIAGAWSRGKVPLELLMNDGALSAKREPTLSYPLGEAFAQALIESQGHDAPLRVLRAFARSNAPGGLSGAGLWRDSMQAAGISFDRVAAAYDAVCAAAVQQEQSFVNDLPRLAATVRIQDGNIVVQPIFAGLPPGQLVCYTYDDDPVAPQFTALRRNHDGTFTWPVARHTGSTFRYLLGWHTTGTRLPVFEPWAEAVPK